MTAAPRSFTAWMLKRGAALAVASLLLPAALSAQDVVERGRAHGVRVPAPVLRTLERDPRAFQFRRAWRNKTQRARLQRAALERRSGPRLSVAQIQGAAAAVTGTLRVPVLLGLPSGTAAPYGTSAYQARLFGDVPGTYSARTFYREMSRGAFTLDGTVSAWQPLPQPASYYNPSELTDATFGRADEFLRDVLTAADPGTNFALFDNDGPDGVPNSGDDDGYVDAAAFLYPSHGAECGGPGIWPHKWTYSAAWGTPFATNDPSASGGMIKVDDYLIQGGVECDGASLMEIGTFAHEMGHALDLPDLYDTDPDNGTTEGLGEWDLMGSGNHRSPDAPAHMGAWSKDFLGWVGVETISAPANGISLGRVYEAGRVLRYNIPNTREYFLLEHRAQTGSDRDLHGPGLLVYHVDPAVIDTTLQNNRVNANPRQGVDLEEADGLDDLANGSGTNRGDAGDPFPGTSARTAFGDATSPSSRSSSGAPSGLELHGITLASGAVTFNLGATTAAPVASVEVSPSPLSLPVGGTRTLSAVLRDASGNVLSGRAVTWSSANTAVAAVSAGGVVSGVSAGGPVAVTATSEGKSGSAQVTVTASASALALGDSLAGDIPTPTVRDTVHLALTAGDVIDIAAHRTGGELLFTPRLELLNAAGVRVATSTVIRSRPRGWILPRYTVPASGTYRVVIWSYYGAQSGEYILRTRRSGPVIAFSYTPASHLRPHGNTAVVRDTLWVYNAGMGSASFTVVPGASPWLTVTPTGGTAPALAGSAPTPSAAAVEPAGPGAQPVAERTAGPARLDRAAAGPALAAMAAPSNGVPIVITANPAGLPQGHHFDSLVVRSVADVWNEEYRMYPNVRVYDPRAQVLDTAGYAFPGTMALGPEGQLVISAGRDLVVVDRQTGARTPWVTGLSSRIDGMEFGPDGSLYAADRAQNRVVRVTQGGDAVAVIEGSVPAYDVALLPDGTLFAAMGSSLVRLGRNGVLTTVLTTTRSIFTYGIVYNPVDGWLYYTASGTLRRFHPSTGADELRGSLPSTSGSVLLNLVAGRGGQLYGAENHTFGSVLVLDTSATLISRLWQPSVGWGLALDEGKLFGSGFLPNYMVWSLPVSDGPAGPSAVLRGDPSGDGAVTAQDALGVLSFVVGKPLPAGWSLDLPADADCNGEVNSVDALIILSRVVGKDVSQFCVGTVR